MRIARIALTAGEPRPRHPWTGESAFAVVDGEEAQLLDAAPWWGGRPMGAPVRWRERSLLAPVDPPKILCVGRNYVAHAKELGNEVPKEPLFFLKPSSSLLANGGTIVLPKESQRVEHEVELAAVIGKRARNVAEHEALSYVFGYTCAGDITARDLQKSDGQWARAKGFDTFCPVGPFVETDVDPGHLAIRCRVGGELRQDGRTSDMVFSTAFLVAYASRMMTLEPGDLLLTGTPAGTGPLAAGKRIELEIEGIGLLACDVASAL